LRVDVVPPAGDGDRGKDGGGASAALVAEEQVVFASQRDPEVEDIVALID
jgi:hypothetical protein